MNRTSRVSTRRMVFTACLAAIASVLTLFELVIPIFPSFLKIDISDLPALIAAFSLGPLSGVTVEFIKNLVGLTHSSSMGIGELANFLVGSALVLGAGLVYKRMHNRVGALIGMLCGTLCMAVIGCLANYVLILPYYINVAGYPENAIISMSSAIVPWVDSLEDVVIAAILPFNLLKGAVISTVTFVIYKPLSPLIHWARSIKEKTS